MPINITKEQCKALIESPERKQKSVLNGLYKNLLKECNELYKSKSSIENAVMESVKLTFGKMDTTEIRLHNLKVMKKYLSVISPCIVSSHLTSHMLALVKKEKGKYSDVIYFNKQIGSDSAYGVAYLNTGVGEGSKLVFSTKITTENNKNEIVLLEKMSAAVQKCLTPNFPIIYKVLHCKDVKEKRKSSYIDITGINDIIKNSRYYVILNELATGDLTHFLENEQHSFIEYESIFFQVFLALRSFHIHTNHIHDDAHYGNFLYHKIAKGGYWHYKYKSLDIYVPNVGYLMVVWDPGLARKIVPKSERLPYIDYYRVYSVMKSYIHQGINIPVELYTQIKLMVSFINNHLNDVNAIMKYLQTKPKFKNILFTKPLNSKIINDTPYML